jgi:capsular polysaccharide biosynthesis protein
MAHTFGWYAFGHFQDSLQRLFPVRDKLIKGTFKLVVSNHGRIVGFNEHISTLLDFNVDNDDFIELKKDNIYFFKKLIVPYSPALLTNYTHETYLWMTKKYFSKYIDSSDSSEIAGIYLSRNHVTPGRRSVKNESEVIDFLKLKGFKILYGTENLTEIINSFFRAKVIIGPHGSLFANTILCKDSCQIYEFCPDNRQDFSFRDKYKAASQYNHILTPADSKFNISIDLQFLTKILNF